MNFEVDGTRYGALRRLVTDASRRVVVSFGGGGLPGICGNLALARLLEQLGVRDHVEEIWGTSAGAVVGGGWASGSSAQQILDVVLGLRKRRAVDIQWLELARAVVMRPFGRPLPDGLISGQVFHDAIARGLQVETFEECPTPFRAIAVTDDGNLQRKVLQHGPLVSAIFASMSLPGIVVPRQGFGYYDGGLVEKTPLRSPIAEHARRGDGRELLLIGTHFDNEANKIAAKGFIARFLQTIYAMEDVMWNYQLDEARKRKDVTLLLLNPRHPEPGGLFDFNRTDENVAQAYEVFRDLLQDAKLGYTLGTI